MNLSSKILTAIFLFCATAFSAENSLKGFHFAALPSASYKDGEGLSLGGNLFFFQYGSGQTTPYLWGLVAGYKQSTKGTISSDVFLDMPNRLGENSRLGVYIEYKRYLLDEYYGLGNDTAYRPEFTYPDHPEFRSDTFYSFYQEYPALFVLSQLPGPVRNLRYFLSLGYYNRNVETKQPPNKLIQDQPLGIAGGTTVLYQFGLVYDTRDQEATPTRGVWSEVLLEHAAPFLGSDYNYVRLTATDRRYITLWPNIVYAHRIVAEPIWGNVPFYDMAVINSSYSRHVGLGGAESLRGVPRLLFVGQHKFLGNFELRFETLHITILRQPLTFFIHTFVDAGRVWLKGDPFTLANMHFSYGTGLHVRWKKDLVGAIDVGRSAYSDFALYITFRNLF